MKRRKKTDYRNFCDIKEKKGEKPQSSKFHVRKRVCKICRCYFIADHPRRIYCEECKDKKW